MMSWEEYIKSNILEFRRRYKRLPEEAKRSFEDGSYGAFISLNKPSQVVVIDFAKSYPKYFIILHRREYPDLEVVVYENLRLERFFQKISKEEPMWLELVDIGRLQSLIRLTLTAATSPVRAEWIYQYHWKAFILVFYEDPRISEYKIADHFHDHVDKILKNKERRNRVEETVKDIKKEVEAIPTVRLRTKILKTTERLETQIKQLDMHYESLKEEVGGVRRLVGTETFGEWKALSSDVEHLRRTHITREAFDAHIRRLDEKIDAVNVRIEDIKAIKFWSKRTLLEIALAIMTVIAALYGAGVIKF